MSAYWTCIECLHYNTEDLNKDGWGYCPEYGKYYPPGDRACSNKFDHKLDYTPSGPCFLTTTICEMFGFEDNCFGLETMRNFRDTVLVNNPRYYELLTEYEVIGPVISENMHNDKHGLEVAEYYYENYIYDIVVNLSTKKDYNDAVDKYVDMVNDMKRMYGVTKEVTNNDVKTLTKKINNNEYKVKSKNK